VTTVAETRAGALWRTGLVVAVALVLALLVTAVVSVLIARRLGNFPVLALLIRVKLFVTTFNAVVLVALVATYAGIYRELPNRFTLGLVVVSVALLLYALSSNPLVWIVLGFRAGGLGPIPFLPDLFAAVAAVVLLAQSGE
jgi:hypothetical protein